MGRKADGDMIKKSGEENRPKCWPNSTVWPAPAPEPAPAHSPAPAQGAPARVRAPARAPAGHVYEWWVGAPVSGLPTAFFEPTYSILDGGVPKYHPFL